MEELVELLVCERIQEILNSYSDKSSMETAGDSDCMEDVLNSLEPEIREAVERFMEEFINRGAEKEKLLYVTGVEDGVRIAKWFLTK